MSSVSCLAPISPLSVVEQDVTGCLGAKAAVRVEELVWATLLVMGTDGDACTVEIPVAGMSNVAVAAGLTFIWTCFVDAGMLFHAAAIRLFASAHAVAPDFAIRTGGIGTGALKVLNAHAS